MLGYQIRLQAEPSHAGLLLVHVFVNQYARKIDTLSTPVSLAETDWLYRPKVPTPRPVGHYHGLCLRPLLL
jgi:hypothetical protein